MIEYPDLTETQKVMLCKIALSIGIVDDGRANGIYWADWIGDEAECFICGFYIHYDDINKHCHLHLKEYEKFLAFI